MNLMVLDVDIVEWEARVKWWVIRSKYVCGKKLVTESKNRSPVSKINFSKIPWAQSEAQSINQINQSLEELFCMCFKLPDFYRPGSINQNLKMLFCKGRNSAVTHLPPGARVQCSPPGGVGVTEKWNCASNVNVVKGCNQPSQSVSQSINPSINQPTDHTTD